MRETKRISPMLDFKFRAKKTKESKPENELIHPRFEVKTTGSFGKKGLIHYWL